MANNNGLGTLLGLSANGGGRGGRGGGRGNAPAEAGDGGGRGNAPSEGGDSPGGIRTSDAPYISGLVDALDHLRKAVGWQVELCHDVHERPTPAGGLLLAKAVEQYRPFFMKDLFAPEDSSWYQRVREQSSTPIAMGELFVNQNEWLPLVANRWIDFMRMHIKFLEGTTDACEDVADALQNVVVKNS